MPWRDGTTVELISMKEGRRGCSESCVDMTKCIYLLAYLFFMSIDLHLSNMNGSIYTDLDIPVGVYRT